MNSFRKTVLYMLSQMDKDFQRKNEDFIKAEFWLPVFNTTQC